MSTLQAFTSRLNVHGRLEPLVNRWRRFAVNRLAVVMLVILCLYAVVACAASVGLIGAGWNARVGPSLQPPSWAQPLGTDRLGRSVLDKTIVAAVTSLAVASSATLICVTIGTILGAAAGYFGGWVDYVIVWLYTTVGSVPGLLLMIALAFVLRDVSIAGYSLHGIPAVGLALGCTAWIGTCRLIRGEVIKHLNHDYIQAAVAVGCSRARIIFIHILPNVIHLVIIKVAIMSVGFIGAEVTLSFLGLGVTNRPSWGTMIDEARMEISQGAWWQMAAATGAVVLLSLAVNVIGDALRDALDPKLR